MIIGISGKIGSGKDLTAEIIQKIAEGKRYMDEIGWVQDREYRKSIWEVRKFADALKDNVCRLLGVTRDKLEDRTYKESPLGEEWWYYDLGNGVPRERFSFKTDEDNQMAEERYLVKPSPRLILQKLGTEGVRDIIHPNAWVNATMSTYDPTTSKWLLTDMRFPNELDAVMKRGGITIRLVRGDGNTGDHPSEVALDDSLNLFDHIIDNNGSIEDLYEQLQDVMLMYNLTPNS